jgi:hypothetical protein
LKIHFNIILQSMHGSPQLTHLSQGNKQN